MKINLGLYMNAKRGYNGSGALNSYAVRNIEQLLKLRDRANNPLSSLNVEVTLARDRKEHRRPTADGMDTTTEMHWTGAYEFDPLKIAGSLVMGQVGDRVTGASAKLLTSPALESFITKLRNRDPDAENVLVLWGHADGPRGFLFSLVSERDNTFPRDILAPKEVDEALAKSSAGLPRMKFICMDACQGACLEFASVIAPYADYFIASQTPVPGTGWSYDSWPRILNNSTAENWHVTAEEIANDFAINNPFNTSISVIRLKDVDAVLQKLKMITLQFLGDAGARTQLVAARRAVPTYDKNLMGLVDLAALFDGAALRLHGLPLGGACRQLADSMRSAIVCSRVSKDLNDRCPMSGCSIFFPTETSAYGKPWDEITQRTYFENPAQLAQFKSTQWHELLKLVVTESLTRPPPR